MTSQAMLPLFAIGISTVFLAVAIHFSILRIISLTLISGRAPHPYRVGLAVYLVLLAHCVEVVVFAAGFYFAVEVADAGSIAGGFSGNFSEYVYFSFVSYTSLGLGDVYPLGPIRLLTGVEALTGLMMIGWSASFTYLCMAELWETVPVRGPHR